ncbi:hypothetical protein [Paenibacillus eucommiae]|uniref:Uncharacterized protein n=1 Tax=Paenibacillus eucommiae TaxID=1355755 RepID=A0ABS4IWB5_9BACL|nr:hypothetical protein [Paenibacillus eucommiae]MBP1991860.1 hypothetical protein [Paenibacillus eucommiae]
MDAKELEEQLAKKLTAGEIENQDAEEAAVKRLPIKTEIRIQAQIDPVVEETKQYRKMAEEVDKRYSRYDKFVDGDSSEGASKSGTESGLESESESASERKTES